MKRSRAQEVQPCEGGVAPLTPQQVAPMLKGLQGWALDGGMIAKTYHFKNYYETMAFVKRRGVDLASRGPPPGHARRLQPSAAFPT